MLDLKTLEHLCNCDFEDWAIKESVEDSSMTIEHIETQRTYEPDGEGFEKNITFIIKINDKYYELVGNENSWEGLSLYSYNEVKPVNRLVTVWEQV